MPTFILMLDLAGTFVFALSGGMTGVRHKLDFFGVLVLSFAAAVSGGILRDVLIGATPPVAIHDWRYLAVSLAAGVVTFYHHANIDRLRSPVLICDAIGLALFAVAGANKALAFELGPVAAVMLGMMTGVGGGMVRDLLVAEIPTVLRSDFYAVAALVGASVVVVGRELQFPPLAVAAVGALICFGLRFLAIRRKWRLPTAGEADESPPVSTSPARQSDKT